MRGNRDRQLRLPRARTDGHQMPPVRSRTALKTHKETMSDTWRSPGQKLKSAIPSGQRTTTSTPNITSDRCARIQRERKSFCRDGHVQSKPSEAETAGTHNAQDARKPGRDAAVDREVETTTANGPTVRCPETTVSGFTAARDLEVNFLRDGTRRVSSVGSNLGPAD